MKTHFIWLLTFASFYCFGQQIKVDTINSCITKPDTYLNQPVYTIVDSMPQYPGGTTKFLSYIAKNINFHSTDKHLLSQTINVTFLIDTMGYAKNVCVIKRKNSNLDIDSRNLEQIKQLIETSEPWTVGYLNGKKVCVRLTIPIRIHYQ